MEKNEQDERKVKDDIKNHEDQIKKQTETKNDLETLIKKNNDLLTNLQSELDSLKKEIEYCSFKKIHKIVS